ncbi:MAG: class I SAM-dependent methyltransferase [Burkholderiaceae bacterium]|nr:class I SAM-dependent methyltransferase [Burkholderiaceae bacterium]
MPIAKSIINGVRANSELGGIHASIREYYSTCIKTHGPTPRGVDWESLATQQMRLVQLMKVCDWSTSFSLNDLGCGYGALLALISERYRDTSVDYLGVDLSPAMVTAARRRWRERKNARFIVGSESPRLADYSVASGIFNVRLDHSTKDWSRLIRSTLEQLHATSKLGFSVNFLSTTSTGPDCAAELFITDAKPWTRFCKDALNAKVELINNYGMNEFTLLVRRD